MNRGDGRWYVTGGPLGNAILLAMVTAGLMSLAFMGFAGLFSS